MVSNEQSTPFGVLLGTGLLKVLVGRFVAISADIFKDGRATLETALLVRYIVDASVVTSWLDVVSVVVVCCAVEEWGVVVLPGVWVVLLKLVTVLVFSVTVDVEVDIVLCVVDMRVDAAYNNEATTLNSSGTVLITPRNYGYLAKQQ
jgi:hypothetical protein